MLDSFADKLRFLRKKAGLTQTALAEKLGLSRSSISGYEMGQFVPDMKALAALSRCFDVSCDWLIGLQPEQTLDPNVKMICEYTGLSEKTVKELHGSFRFKHTDLPEEVPGDLAEMVESLFMFYSHAERELVGHRKMYDEACLSAIKTTARKKASAQVYNPKK